MCGRRNGLGTGWQMPRLRLILIRAGVILCCAMIGWGAGCAVGMEVAKSRIRSAPAGVGHGVVYVAAGERIIVSEVGLCVGALVGVAFVVWRVRGRPRSGRGTG